jgi:hypothetical protein
MFTGSMFKDSDTSELHYLFNKVSYLIDQGYIQTNAVKNLRAAHELLESGKSIGKIVL